MKVEELRAVLVPSDRTVTPEDPGYETDPNCGNFGCRFCISHGALDRLIEKLAKL